MLAKGLDRTGLRCLVTVAANNATLARAAVCRTLHTRGRAVFMLLEMWAWLRNQQIICARAKTWHTFVVAVLEVWSQKHWKTVESSEELKSHHLHARYCENTNEAGRLVLQLL
jgi:hypothetical protein